MQGGRETQGRRHTQIGGTALDEDVYSPALRHVSRQAFGQVFRHAFRHVFRHVFRRVFLTCGSTCVLRCALDMPE